MTTREDCVAADRKDPLASLKARFELPPGVLYMDGNSLGVSPKAAAARAADVITQEWATGLIRSWNTAGWFELPARLGDKLGSLLGAREGELVVTDTIPLSEQGQASGKIRQLSCAALLGETILRISNAESVSSLFVD